MANVPESQWRDKLPIRNGGAKMTYGTGAHWFKSQKTRGLRLTLKMATWRAKKNQRFVVSKGERTISTVSLNGRQKQTPRTGKERETSVLVWNTILRWTHDWGAPEIKLIKIKRRVQRASK